VRNARARRGAGIALAIVVAALLAGRSPAQAPPDFTDEAGLPGGKRGERVRQVLEALQSGEGARLEGLVRDVFAPSFRDAVPLEQHLAVLGEWADASRGYEPKGVRRYVPAEPPERLTVIAKNRLTGAWEGLSFEFDGTPDERLRGLVVNPARPPKDVPAAPPLDVKAATAELSAYLDRLAEAEVFSGSVLLAKDGKVVFQGARGLAERNHGVPNAVDSKFNLGSMNKMFTAVVTARLVEDGKLAFEDPVSKYLAGEGWTKADLATVRVENLLTHTSGLGSYFNDKYERTARQLFRKVADYKPLVADETLAFPPGTKWQYSNTGFLVMGAVLEKASGRDYFDLVRERLYGPAGMKDTDCYDIDLVVPKLAIGYSHERTGDTRRWRANTFAHVIRGGPAGGGYSTAPDLLAFAEALRSGRLVRPDTLERLWSPKPALSSPRYGYGFGIETTPAGRVVGHSGGFEGISSNLDIFPDSGWVAVVLSNVDGGSRPVQQKMRELIAKVRP
jgi:CubicO group peptidase (beta-lactamase class C family)